MDCPPGRVATACTRRLEIACRGPKNRMGAHGVRCSTRLWLMASARENQTRKQAKRRRTPHSRGPSPFRTLFPVLLYLMTAGDKGSAVVVRGIGEEVVQHCQRQAVQHLGPHRADGPDRAAQRILECKSAGTRVAAADQDVGQAVAVDVA